jgi:CRP-like cAMP-binding protein
VLLAGRVKVARVDRNGREVMLAIGDPGDVLGELALIGKEPRIATVTALEPVVALVVGARAFQAHLACRPSVSFAITQVLARRFRAAQLERWQLSTLDTMGRLAARLLELAARYGEPTATGVQVDLPITQEELAAWMAVSRAGMSQALHSLRELGWIELSRRTLLVRDLEALRARSQ